MPPYQEPAMPITVFVPEVTAADLPPIPDREVADRYFAAGRDHPLAGQPPREAHVGHYQYLTLDTRSGELRFRGLPWHTRKNGDSLFVGETHAPMHWDHVPDLIYYVIDSGFGALPYLTAQQGVALANKVAPLAQTLVDNLVPIPGTDRRDWSRAAASASLDIHRALQREPQPPLGPRPSLIEMAEAVEKVPELVEPRFADYTDRELDRRADAITRFATSENWFPQLAVMFGWNDPGDPHSPAWQDYPHVIGAYAWLYHYRQQIAENRVPLDAEAWFARPGNGIEDDVVLADADEAEIERRAAAAQSAATAENIKLLGTAQYLRESRARARRQLFAGLEPLGKNLTDTRNDLRRARSAVYARIVQIDSWGDPLFENQAEIARLAGMSRQMVDKLLKKVQEEDDDAGE
jgi:hypothetical protein